MKTATPKKPQNALVDDPQPRQRSSDMPRTLIVVNINGSPTILSTDCPVVKETVDGYGTLADEILTIEGDWYKLPRGFYLFTSDVHPFEGVARPVLPGELHSLYVMTPGS